MKFRGEAREISPLRLAAAPAPDYRCLKRTDGVLVKCPHHLDPPCPGKIEV